MRFANKNIDILWHDGGTLKINPLIIYLNQVTGLEVWNEQQNISHMFLYGPNAPVIRMIMEPQFTASGGWTSHFKKYVCPILQIFPQFWGEHKPAP